jgi:hypothetical protein
MSLAQRIALGSTCLASAWELDEDGHAEKGSNAHKPRQTFLNVIGTRAINLSFD